MIIDSALKRRIKIFLPKNYRKIIVQRLLEKGKTYHPNTIRNVLNGSPNLEVAQEILEVCREQRSVLKKFRRHARASVATAA